MISICGYSFFRDVNSCDQIALDSEITEINLQNAAYNFIDVTPNLDKGFAQYNNEYDSGITIVNSDFNHSIFKRLIEVDLNDVAKIVVSRYSTLDGNWATIGEYVLSNANTVDANINVLRTILEDQSVTTRTYTYKFEYYKWNNGELILDESMTVLKEFEVQLAANFLSDDTETFPLYMNMQVSAVRNQSVSTVTPLQRKYPIVIKNAMTNYHSGSIGAAVMSEFVIQELQSGKGYSADAQEAIRLLRNRITNFLTNGKNKTFRTTSGDVWCIQVTGNVNVSFSIIGGKYMCDFSFDYVEVANGQSIEGIEKVNS